MSEEIQQIDDEEGYVRKRRMKQIFDVRDNLQQKRRKIEFEQQNEQGHIEFLNGYRTLVKDYLMTIEPLLEQYELGEELLRETDFGTVKVEPVIRTLDSRTKPSVELQFQTGDWVKIKREDIPQKKQHSLTGLISLYRVPSPVEIHSEVEVLDTRNVHGGTWETIEYMNKVQITLSQLDMMVRGMNQFLAKIGLELEPEPEENPAELSV